MEPYYVRRDQRKKLPASFVATASDIANLVFGTHCTFDAELQAINFNGHLIPLTRLYNSVGSPDKIHWHKPLKHRFEDVAATIQQIHVATQSWVSAKPNLNVCVRRQSGDNQICQPITQDICYTLVIDAEDFCVRVTTKHLRSWGVAHNEAWQAGLTNNTGSLTVDHQHTTSNGSDLAILTGGLCTSGVVTNLKQHLPAEQFFGKFLLAFPTFETVILIPADSDAALSSIQQVRRILPKWLANSEHPLSSELFTLDKSGDLEIVDANELPQG